jgi:hypothetical protein
MAANRRASEFRHRASKRKPFFDTLKCQKCPSKPSPTWNQTWIYEGADSRIRTDDLLITNQLLYQLSYAGICLEQPCNGAPRMLNAAVYTTICTLLKQISRMAADTAAATGHGLRKDDGIAASQKRRKPAYENKKLAF